MDGRANLARLLAACRAAPAPAPPSAGRDVVCAEQAVFTSVPGPLGRGYRLVAASGGITPDEKREIVQCGPSHGSLCDPGPEAAGLASFPLAGGRRCLFLACHAGREQTARGGMRVHTHVVVLNPQGERALGCDPLRIEAAVRAALGTRWDTFVQRPPMQLETLAIDPACPGPPPPVCVADDAEAESMLGVLAAVLAGREALIVGVPRPRALIAAVLPVTPLGCRARLSLSLGFRFSPARRFSLMLTEATPVEAQRVTQEHELDVHEWGALTRGAAAPSDWLSLAREAWRAGTRSASDLAERVAEACPPAVLDQIAQVYRDLDTVPTADAALLQELTGRHAAGGVVPAHPVLAALRAEFQAALTARRSALSES